MRLTIRHLAAFLIIFACLAQTACDPIRELNKGAYRAQAVLHQIPPALLDMETQGQISRAEEKEIARAGNDVNDLNNEFIDLLKPPLGGSERKWTKAYKAEVAGKLDQIAAALLRLDSAGTLHIKNETAKATFDGFIRTLRTILQSAREAL